MTRLGFFGGAFDPPHRAHVALAEAAVRQLQLDQLRISPTGDAWHKARPLTDARHRVAMSRLAFSGIPAAVIDEREVRRAGATYTIDTLRELHAEQPQAELFLLMGEDQAAGFRSWRDWEAIAALATLAVARRRYAVGPQPALDLPPGVRAVLLELPILAESATEVRQRLTAGQDITQLVPPAVASYIGHHCLYTPS